MTEPSQAAARADAAFFPGFRQSFVETHGVEVEGGSASGATINTLVGGSGPPLLLLHGHPQTHVTWHKVAARLARSHTVVMTDLRGYGDSSKPEGGPGHIDFSKTAMGADQFQVMRALGFESFQAIGHDRGGRVLHHMMLEHPGPVARGVVLDIAPTQAMYDRTNQEFATKYFWWFFQIQEAPLPETMIGADTELYVRTHLDAQSKTPGAVSPAAFAEYLRCYRDPASIHAVCEDYRAGATIDARQIAAAKRRAGKIAAPLFAIWGGKGTVGKLFDVIGLWREEAEQVAGQALPCGHLIPEEDPDGLLGLLQQYLSA